MKHQKTLSIIVLSLGAGLLVGSFLNVAPASAGFWDSLSKLFSFPGVSNVTTTSVAKKDVPLYEPSIDYERAVIAAVKKASPAVVSITISKNVPIIENCPYDPFGNIPPEFQQFFGDNSGFTQPCDSGKTQLQEVGGGSGFIISSDGMILTNKHVVSDTKASYTVFTNDGKKYDATVLARDPAQDLAVIKITASDLPTLLLGDSDSVELGQTAIAIGNALGEYRNTVSVGSISGLARTVTASDANLGAETIEGVIQTDAAINPGNSGGPLLNLKGEVVGINTAIAEGAQNIGFAIPINRAKRDITSVKNGGEIQAPYLGVRYLSITPDVKEKQKLSVDYGALVRGNNDGPAVIVGSPAAKAGIQAEDIILEVNGAKINVDHTLSGEISKYSVGDTVTLKVNRAGKEIELKATLTKRPAE
jgi:serine protease Do